VIRYFRKRLQSRFFAKTALVGIIFAVAVFFILISLPGKLTADLVSSREILVSIGDDSAILPVWMVNGRSLFSMEDLLPLDKMNVSRSSDMLQIKARKHSLKILLDNPFILLDGRTLLLDGKVLSAERNFLVDSWLLEKLTECGLLNAEFNLEEGTLDLSPSSVGLWREELDGGELLRLRMNEIPVFESDPQANLLKLLLPFDSTTREFTRLGEVNSIIAKHLIKDFRVSQSSANQLELQFELAEFAELYEVREVEARTEIQIVIKERGRKLKADFIQEEPELQIADALRTIELDLIVIDPGHGGKDPGAVSPRGNYEKTMVLGISKKLKALIEKRMPKVKVLMTRDNDRFISLRGRTDFANSKKAKLFVSIHANSAKDKRARGYEVFFLRPGKNNYARQVAMRENSVLSFEENQGDVIKKGPNWILASMAQSAYVHDSQNLAAMISKQMESVGHKRKRSVQQAGFHVLVGASMPAVLFECGFLTNRKDEKQLMSKTGQDKIAEALYKAVSQFKDHYR